MNHGVQKSFSRKTPQIYAVAFVFRDHNTTNVQMHVEQFFTEAAIFSGESAEYSRCIEQSRINPAYLVF